MESVFCSWKPRSLSLTGRSVVIGMLGLSTLWYLASVVHVSPDVVKAVNTMVFSFLWGNKPEKVKRLSVTEPLDNGGLGVTDVARKILALRILWVKRYLIGEDHPWKAFFRYHLQRAFLASPVERAFVLTTTGSSTLRRLPPFYRSVIEAWQTIQGTSIGKRWVIPIEGKEPVPLATITAKQAYTILGMQSNYQHRCVSKYDSLDIEWSTVWTNLRLLRFDRPVRDTSWQIAHGILPTVDRLFRFGILGLNPTCHCGGTESHEHLFDTCPLAVLLTKWYHRYLKRWRPSIGMPSPREMRFSFHRSDQVPPGFVVLSGVIKHNIWLARNSFRFEQKIPDPQEVLKKIKSTFEFLLSITQRNCPSTRFSNKWLVDGILGSISHDGTLSVLPRFP